MISWKIRNGLGPAIPMNTHFLHTLQLPFCNIGLLTVLLFARKSRCAWLGHGAGVVECLVAMEIVI